MRTHTHTHTHAQIFSTHTHKHSPCYCPPLLLKHHKGHCRHEEREDDQVRRLQRAKNRRPSHPSQQHNGVMAIVFTSDGGRNGELSPTTRERAMLSGGVCGRERPLARAQTLLSLYIKRVVVQLGSHPTPRMLGLGIHAWEKVGFFCIRCCGRERAGRKRFRASLSSVCRPFSVSERVSNNAFVCAFDPAKRTGIQCTWSPTMRPIRQRWCDGWMIRPSSAGSL